MFELALLRKRQSWKTNSLFAQFPIVRRCYISHVAGGVLCSRGKTTRKTLVKCAFSWRLCGRSEIAKVYFDHGRSVWTLAVRAHVRSVKLPSTCFCCIDHLICAWFCTLCELLCQTKTAGQFNRHLFNHTVTHYHVTVDAHQSSTAVFVNHFKFIVVSGCLNCSNWSTCFTRAEHRFDSSK